MGIQRYTGWCLVGSALFVALWVAVRELKAIKFA